MSKSEKKTGHVNTTEKKEKGPIAKLNDAEEKRTFPSIMNETQYSPQKAQETDHGNCEDNSKKETCETDVDTHGSENLENKKDRGIKDNVKNEVCQILLCYGENYIKPQFVLSLLSLLENCYIF